MISDALVTFGLVALAAAVVYCVRRFSAILIEKERLWLEDRREIRQHHEAILKAATDGMRDLALMLKAQNVQQYAAVKGNEQPAVFNGVTMTDERDAMVAEERARGERQPVVQDPPGPVDRKRAWIDRRPVVVPAADADPQPVKDLF